MPHRQPADCAPPGSWTPINAGAESIRSEVAERMGISPGQELRGDVLVTARVRTNEIIRDESR